MFLVFTENEKNGSYTVFYLLIYDVQCVLQDKTHSGEDIVQAVRCLLRGEAGRIIVNL